MFVGAERRAVYPSPDWVAAGDQAAALAGDLQMVREGGTVHIFEAECDPTIYNDPFVLEAFRRIKRVQEAVIRVLTGPILLLGDSGTNGILDLQEEGVIDELLHRPARSFYGNFRVIEVPERYHLYKVFPYHPQVPPDQWERLLVENLSDEQVQGTAAVEVKVFDMWIEFVRKYSTPVPLPLVATREGLHQIMDEAERKFGFSSFDYAEPEQLLNLSKGHDWVKPLPS